MPLLVEYHVALAQRARHLFEVRGRFPTQGAEHVNLKLPVWTPGSYLIREYERHLQELECASEQGDPLPVRKIGKASWQVDTRGAAAVVARWRVYAHEVTVRTAHLDETHAFWNGANLLLYVDALRCAPARLTLEVPTGWQVATALQPASDAATTAPSPSPSPSGTVATFVYDAPDYDTLVDSPVEASPHERIDFTAQGRPHAFALWGSAPSLGLIDRRRFALDVTAIIDAQAALFGGVPYDRYTFLLHLVPNAYGGLEHKSSSTLLANPLSFTQEKRYQELLELISHEYFHLWNGKRIRPQVLGPFDYERECPTRSLWVVEGITSYYDRLFLRRSGRLSPARYLEKVGEDLSKLARIPGRSLQSLEESSWDAWIKLYRPDENSVNSTVSYYLKGGIVALLLDLEIRRRSDGARTLDDALRLFWTRYQAEDRGYADDEVQPLIEEATGLDLDDFFAHAVRGRGELDLDGPFSSVGLTVKRSGAASTADTPQDTSEDTAATTPNDEPRIGAWLGASLRQDNGRLKVTEALSDSPAQTSHLYPGDEIIACDNLRIDDVGLRERIANARPGDSLRLTIFRRDELKETTVVLGRRPNDKIELVPMTDATAAARENYQRWMGEELK